MPDEDDKKQTVEEEGLHAADTVKNSIDVVKRDNEQTADDDITQLKVSVGEWATAINALTDRLTLLEERLEGLMEQPADTELSVALQPGITEEVTEQTLPKVAGRRTLRLKRPRRAR